MELFYPVKKVLSISFAFIQFQLNIALSIKGVTACFSDCDQMLEFLASCRYSCICGSGNWDSTTSLTCTITISSTVDGKIIFWLQVCFSCQWCQDWSFLMAVAK